MDWKTRLTCTLRSATSDKEDLNRRILRWNKSFCEVKKILNQGKCSGKGDH
ncbi:MAG: hypothetical protein PHV18_13580 [Lachnospiraceae bacterium]|nr:hypothetical protein [Lachnospiraceae bacterium]